MPADPPAKQLSDAVRWFPHRAELAGLGSMRWDRDPDEWAAGVVRDLAAGDSFAQSEASLTVAEWCLTPADPAANQDPPAEWWGSPLGRLVAHVRHEDPMSTMAVAAVLGVTRQRVDQLVGRDDLERVGRGLISRQSLHRYLARR